VQAHIRAATSEDAAAITFVYLESAEHHAAIDPERNYVPERAAIEERYRSGKQHPSEPAVTLVAEADGSVVGFIDARIGETFDPMYRPARYCFVADIAVARAHRSKRIGEQLIEAIEKWAASQGATAMLLEYHVGNTRVADFYKRQGYRPASVVAYKSI